MNKHDVSRKIIIEQMIISNMKIEPHDKGHAMDERSLNRNAMGTVTRVPVPMVKII